MGLRTLTFLLNHPLSSRNKAASFRRFAAWQLGTKLLRMPVAVDFVNGSRLLVRPGMKGLTGNVYAGLHEFEHMSFVLHALRAPDTFVDVGANVGSYTVLAGAAVHARCIAFEPVPSTYRHLVDNVNLNAIYATTACHNVGIGSARGTLRFTSDGGPENHVVTASEVDTDAVSVQVERLDDRLQDDRPLIVKIDVEGWEAEVVAGAHRILSAPPPLAVIMELTGHGARYGFDEDAVHRKMLDYDFDTAMYEPLGRELVSLGGKRKQQGNTIYIKDAGYFSERLRAAPTYSVLGLHI